MTLSITLPWPHQDLSPNSRVHWAKLAQRKAKAKQDAYWATKHAGEGSLPPSAEISRIRLSLRFAPPSNRHYDLDGLISRFKAAQDGIAQAIGVNDRNFSYGVIEMLPKQKGGLVYVTVEAV